MAPLWVPTKAMTRPSGYSMSRVIGRTPLQINMAYPAHVFLFTTLADAAAVIAIVVVAILGKARCCAEC